MEKSNFLSFFLSSLLSSGMTWTVRSEYLTPAMNEFVKKLDSKFGILNAECGELKGSPLDIPQSALRNPNPTEGVRIIKSNKARTTLSAPFVNGQRVIVKRYHSKGWFERIKYLFRPSRAKAEWDMMNALLNKGISTCVPLAYGERRRWGFLLEGSLIVKEIPDCLSFQAYIKRHCSGIQSKDKILLKRELLKKLADFIRNIHEKNIDHRDFHGGNILVTETDSGNPVFYLIDLHKARVCNRLSLRRKINSLALQCDIPGFPFSRTDCMRLIKYYNNYCPPAPSLPLEGGGVTCLFHAKKDFKGFALKMLKRIEILKNKRLKSTTRWCLKLSNVFAVYKSKGIRIYYRKEYPLADILDLLKRVGNYSAGLHRHNIITTTPQSLPLQGGDKGEVKQILKRSSKSVVFLEEIPFSGVSKKVIVKYNFRRGFFDMLKKTFLGTRSRKAWIAANALIVRGIPTPQPIALIEKKSFGFTRDNFLITEYIDDSLRVNDYVSKYFNSNLNPPTPFNKGGMGGLRGIKRKKLFIEELARLVRLFHDTEIYHCDLCGVNILVKEGQQENWEMFIIDLDSVSLWKRLTLRRRLENFSQINSSFSNVTNADRMRFFKAYFRGLPPKAHEYLKEIDKHIEARRIRKLRQSRRKRSHPIHGT